MNELDRLAIQFEAERGHLRAVAYRLLGSLADADDAVQDAWLRLSRSEAAGVENLRAWLTTVVARVCLNMLRSRKQRGEQPLDFHVPDPVMSRVDERDPENEAVLGESVGLAMLVVLDRLTPAERLAFVLHDVFGVPFDEISSILDSSVASARQLASRARRRVKLSAPVPDVDAARQQEVVTAFFAASRNGDFAGLVALLDPDVVLRSDGGPLRASASRVVRGSTSLAAQAITFADGAPFALPALVNGAAGVVIARGGRPISVMGFVVRGDKIVAIDVLADPTRLAQLDLAEWLG